MTTFRDIFKASFLDSFSTANIPVMDIAESFLIAAVLGAYLFFLYQHVTRKAFYDKYFNMSIPVLCVIVCAVVLTIQFNIVVSLGMVGALSIVRFRTAVKSPMDLVFLFWAIADQHFDAQKMDLFLTDYEATMFAPLSKNWARFWGSQNNRAEEFAHNIARTNEFFANRRQVVASWFS